MSGIIVASVRGIKNVDGTFVKKVEKEEEYADSPDIESLVEEKPKSKRNKPKQVEVEEQESQEEPEKESEQESQE